MRVIREGGNVSLVRVVARDKVIQINLAQYEADPESFNEAGLKGDRVLIETSGLPVLLSKSEKRVFDKLVDATLMNKEIAAALGMTENGVKFHATNIYKAFGVRRRIELLAAIGR